MSIQSSDSDILIPKFWPRRDEIAHQTNALFILQHCYFDTLGANIILRSLERDVLAHYDARNLVEQHRSTAHWAGREGGVKNASLVNRGGQPAGIFQAV